MHATTWMNLEDIILSEKSQPPKDKHRMVLLLSFLKQSNPQKRGAE